MYYRPRRNVRKDGDSSLRSSMTQENSTQKSEQARFCAVVAESSPTGRDAAGRLYRKVPGEVSEAAAAYRNTQSADDTEHSKSNSRRNVRASRLSVLSSDADADRRDEPWCRRRA